MNYSQTGKRIGELVQLKNEQYGNAFHEAGNFLEILFPHGIRPEQYKDMLGIIRVFDKQMRIANGNKGDENAWYDIAGYGILMSGEQKDDTQNNPKQAQPPEITPHGEEL